MKKQWNRLMIVVMTLSIAIVFTACSNQATVSNEAEAGKIKIVTTIAQIADPIAIIGGDQVQVTGLMGPGVDPHLYKATPGDISKLENSEMIFYSGLHLEANMVPVFDEMSKSKPVLAISESIAQDKLLRDSNGAIDPHVWFDIDLWQEALSAATEALKEHAPNHAEYFENNKNNYFAELQALKEESRQKLQQIPSEQRILITAHDAFGYFGRMNDIEVIGLQGLSTEDEVGLSEIEDTIDTLIQYRVPAIFIESSINPDSIHAVIEGAKKHGLNVRLGGELYSDAMGDAGSVEGTYLGMYKHNVETIYNALLGKGE